MFLLSEKEAKIAKEKELGIYKEKKVTACSLKNYEIRKGQLVRARQRQEAKSDGQTLRGGLKTFKQTDRNTNSCGSSQVAYCRSP